jgi:hypothetical protein
MSVIKSLSKKAWVHRLICSLLAAYIRFVRLTTKWSVVGTGSRDELFGEGKPFIIALWHNRICMMPYAYAEQAKKLCVVTSGHRDGRLVLDTMERFGFDGIPIDSKDTTRATRAIIKRLKEGRHVGITPDGPRGPALEVKDGIIFIAAMAGVPIIPVSYSVKKRKTLNTWDRFQVPLPFNRGICRWGEPIYIQKKPDAEAQERCRQDLYNSLQTLTKTCDQEMGHLS